MSSLEDSHFNYASIPLDPTQNDIRLVCLAPGVGSAILKGTISKASLEDKPLYEALSYAWGDSSLREQISLNELPFHVTTNLSIALRHLRYPDRARTLWIDAICINQRDISERNHQVRRMKSIYERAEIVTVWLGQDEDESDLAMDGISQVAEVHHKYTNVNGVFSPSSENARLMIAIGEIPGMVQAVFKLLNRAWWERSWVLQEVIAARKVMVVCGNMELSWSDMTWGVLFFQLALMPFIIGPITEAMHSLRQRFDTIGFNLDVTRGYSSRTDFPTIHDLLYLQRLSKASDPRDKIFALLSLMPDDGPAAYSPDYCKPANQVFEEFTRHLLASSKVLWALQFKNTPVEPDGLPSWVPNWGVQLHQPLGYRFSGKNLYNACTGIESGVEFLDDVRALRLSAAIFDKISHTFSYDLNNADNTGVETTISTRLQKTFPFNRF